MQQPLWDEAAEKTLLANAIAQGSAAPLGELEEQQLYFRRHQIIFRALRALDDSSQPIDFQTVWNWVQENGFEKHCSASEITGLDIGVPLYPVNGNGHSTGLESARQQIIALDLKRQAAAESYKLTEAVKSGDTEAIAEQAAKVAELSKPAVAKPEPEKPEPDCPAVPEQAWHGLAKLYREAVKGTTEASDNFHYASFLMAAGAGLGKHVFTKMGGTIYPNLYIVLYGRSGRARKGTAITRAMQLVNCTAPMVTRMFSIDSAEGLIESMKRIKTEMEAKRDSTVIVTLSELRSLIEKAAQKGLGGIMPMLCDAYDAPPRMETNTKHSRSFVDDPPLLSIFAATSGSYLQKLQKEDVEGGMGNRVMWIPGENKGRIPRPPEPDPEFWNPLVLKLGETFKHWSEKGRTELRWSKEAEDCWDPFYNDLDNYGRENEVIAVLADRFHCHALKAALIFAALDMSPVIEVYHVRSAIAVAEYLLRSLNYIFEGFGVSSWVKEEQEMLEIITREKMITPRDLRRKKRFRDMSLETFNRRIKALTEGAYSACELYKMNAKKTVLRARG